jgi:hypothetical protein
MPTTTKLEITCPNNHDQIVAFTRDEFDEKLSAGPLQFHCNTCDTDWQSSRKELEQFRRKFRKSERDSM